WPRVIRGRRPAAARTYSESEHRSEIPEGSHPRYAASRFPSVLAGRYLYIPGSSFHSISHSGRFIFIYDENGKFGAVGAGRSLAFWQGKVKTGSRRHVEAR